MSLHAGYVAQLAHLLLLLKVPTTILSVRHTKETCVISSVTTMIYFIVYLRAHISNNHNLIKNETFKTTSELGVLCYLYVHHLLRHEACALRLYIRKTVSYGCETWSLTLREENRQS